MLLKYHISSGNKNNASSKHASNNNAFLLVTEQL